MEMILGLLLIASLFWIIGYFVALLITGGIARRWWTKLLQALLGLAIGLGFMGCLYLSAESDAREYNNGVCTDCGGEYKFSGSSGRGVSKFYYYTCADCDHTIQVESLQK